MTGEAERYWAEFEAETGERVLARTMGQWFEEPSSSDGHWGLLILTDRSFRYRHQPSDNWFSNLVKSQAKSSRPRGPIEIVVPRESLLSLEEPRPGLLGRLFGPAMPRFRLTWKEAVPAGEGRADSGLFSAADTKPFLAALRQALPSA